MNKIEHGDVILADRGFDIADDLGVYGARLVIPSFTRRRSKKKQHSERSKAAKKKQHFKKVAKVRIHVERIIGLLKNKYNTSRYSTVVFNKAQKRE